ncbi:MAG: hypothetical protein KME21_02100 [Desmonostoc vinosum HA7617-LM4]|nr:hypothetical protein [Desmonostoc vinosum HA7617-LM4]
MFNLFLLLNITLLIAFVIGLINPKLVLRGNKRTRRQSSKVYFFAFVLSFVGMLSFVPKSKPMRVVTPTTKTNDFTMCENFATQKEAQAALSSNPQLDKDGNGTACDSFSFGGKERVDSSKSRSSRSHKRRRRRRRR